jgi:hypothetical protein
VFAPKYVRLQKDLRDNSVSPHIQIQLKLNMNAPVRCLRAAPFNENILATHGQDDTDVHIWRMPFQGDMQNEPDGRCNTPDLTYVPI